MGLTRFKGPVYGAKSLLWAYGPAVCDTPSTAANSSQLYKNGSIRIVPPYEDWYITELYGDFSTCSSLGVHTLTLKTKGGSTALMAALETAGNGSTRAATIVSVATPAATSTTANVVGTVTNDAGEYEGYWVPAGSTLRMVYLHAGSTTAEVMTGGWQVSGFIRFRNSTRAEA